MTVICERDSERRMRASTNESQYIGLFVIV